MLSGCNHFSELPAERGKDKQQCVSFKTFDNLNTLDYDILEEKDNPNRSKKVKRDLQNINRNSLQQLLLKSILILGFHLQVRQAWNDPKQRNQNYNHEQGNK